MKTVYNPKSSGATLLFSADGSTLLTDKDAIFEGGADHKSSYLFENLPVQTEIAFCQGPIFIATLLYEQFLHLIQINLHPNTQLLSTQQHAYQSLFSYFLF